jgi:hypothetical protein
MNDEEILKSMIGGNIPTITGFAESSNLTPNHIKKDRIAAMGIPHIAPEDTFSPSKIQIIP